MKKDQLLAHECSCASDFKVFSCVVLQFVCYIVLFVLYGLLAEFVFVLYLMYLLSFLYLDLAINGMWQVMLHTVLVHMCSILWSAINSC